MGKQKNAQRTKGNTKPSSSGRTAEILGGASGYIGFCGLDGVNFIPASSQFEDDTQVASEFRVPLKSMSKKDHITRVKALQEFIQLCDTADKDAVISVIPFWPRIFSQLSLDPAYKVREATQQANQVFCKQIGRNLGPHIKSMMPSWLLSMNDPVESIAVASTGSFMETFSKAKRLKVLQYCSKEILDYIHENLSVARPTALRNKYSTATESEELHSRVVCCSLTSLTSFIGIMATLELDDLTTIKQILSKKFWKYPNHKDPSIRAAWYHLIYELMDKHPQVIENCLDNLSPCMMVCLGETHLCVVPSCWKTFLKYTDTFKESFESNNFETVSNDICRAVANGGHGACSHVYKRLSSILSILPTSVTTEEFYISFFKGFVARETLSCVARWVGNQPHYILESLFTCLEMKKDDICNSDLVLQSVVGTTLIGFIQECWMTHKALLKSDFIKRLANLLVSNQDSKLSTIFWTEFMELIENAIDKPEEQVEALCEMVHQMKPILKAHDKYYNEICLKMASLIKKSHDHFMKGEDNFNLFVHLLACFYSNTAVAFILNKQLSDHKDAIEEILVPIVAKSLDYGVDAQVTLFISLYENLEDNAKRNALQNPRAMSWPMTVKIVERLVKNEDPIAYAWLKSAPFGHKLVKAAEQWAALVMTPDTSAMSSLKDDLKPLFIFVFNNGNKKEPLFSLEYVSQTLSVFVSLFQTVDLIELPEPNEEMFSHVKKFIEIVLHKPYCWEMPGLIEAICLMYKRWCYSDHDTESVKEAMQIVNMSLELFTKNVTDDNSLIDSLMEETKSMTEHCTFMMVSDIINLWLDFMRNTDKSIRQRIVLSFVYKTETDKMSLSANVINEMFLSGVYYEDIPIVVPIEDLKTPKMSLIQLQLIQMVLDDQCILPEELIDAISVAMYCERYVQQALHLQYENTEVGFHEDLNQGLTLLETGLRKLISSMKASNVRNIIILISKRCDNINWRSVFHNCLRKWFEKFDFSICERNILFESTAQALIPYASQDLVEKRLTTACQALPFVNLQSTSSLLTEIALGLQRLEKETGCTYIDQIFSIYENWQNVSKEFHTNISENWQNCSFHVVSLNLFKVLTECYDDVLQQKHWDLMLCSLTQWSQQLEAFSKDVFSNTALALLTSSACNLCSTLSKVVASEHNKDKRPPLLTEEWEKVYRAPLYHIFFKILVQCVDTHNQCVSVTMGNTLHSISSFLITIPMETLLTTEFPSVLSVESCLPSDMQSLLSQLMPMISVLNYDIQVMVYSLVRRLLPQIMENWYKNIEEPEPTNAILPNFIINAIQHSVEVVQTLTLEDFGEYVHADGKTQLRSTGYFLSFMLLLDWCELDTNENREFCATYLVKEGILDNLLNFMFCVSPFHNAKKKDFRYYEEFEISLNNKNIQPHNRHEIIGTRLYMHVLSVLPMFARSWYTHLDRNQQKMVDHFTIQNISPYIINREFDIINKSEVSFDNMKVVCRRATREVVATYTMDDASMEIILKVAANHPLSNIVIDCHKRFLFSKNEWNSWVKSMITMFVVRNSSLLDTLRVFYKNVESRLSGYEECCICYYVIHNRTNELPKTSCKTCKKKFHGCCLYHWICQSTQNASCPMCRSPI